LTADIDGMFFGWSFTKYVHFLSIGFYFQSEILTNLWIELLSREYLNKPSTYLNCCSHGTY